MAVIGITQEGSGEVVIRFIPDAGILSKSGKSKVVTTTSGFVGIAGTDMQVSLNVIKPK